MFSDIVVGYNKNDFFYNSDGIGFDMDSNEHIIQKN